MKRLHGFRVVDRVPDFETFVAGRPRAVIDDTLG